MSISELTKTEDLICHNKNIHRKLQAGNDVEVVINYVKEKEDFDIRKVIQIVTLLLIILPSILLDELATVRTFRTNIARVSRTIRARRSESDIYILD